MLEYISQHWYAGVALALLALLTVFMFIMAVVSGRKRNAERERIIAEIESGKSSQKLMKILLLPSVTITALLSESAQIFR